MSLLNETYFNIVNNNPSNIIIMK